MHPKSQSGGGEHTSAGGSVRSELRSARCGRSAQCCCVSRSLSLPHTRAVHPSWHARYCPHKQRWRHDAARTSAPSSPAALPCSPPHSPRTPPARHATRQARRERLSPWGCARRTPPPPPARRQSVADSPRFTLPPSLASVLAGCGELNAVCCELQLSGEAAHEERARGSGGGARSSSSTACLSSAPLLPFRLGHTVGVQPARPLLRARQPLRSGAAGLRASRPALLPGQRRRALLRGGRRRLPAQECNGGSRQ